MTATGPIMPLHHFLQDTGLVLAETRISADGTANRIWVVKDREDTRHTFYAVSRSSFRAADLHLGLIERKPGQAPELPLLIVADTITPVARKKATEWGASYIDLQSGYGCIGGESYGRMPQASRPQSRRRRVWTDEGLLRLILLSQAPQGQKELAGILQTHQPAISRSFKRLREAIGIDNFYREEDRNKILAYLIEQTDTSTPIATFWKKKSPLIEQVQSAYTFLERNGVNVAVGELIAADRYFPWKNPQMGVLYSSATQDLEDIGFVETTEDKATLRLVMPKDPTLLKTATWWSNRSNFEGMVYTDPVQTYLDLQKSEESDTRESAERLRQLLIQGWNR